MIMVQFKEIKGYEGRYLVSDDGNVWSLKGTHGKPRTEPYKLSPNDCGNGYKKVVLTDVHRKQKTHYVHRLVAEAFCPNDDPEHKVEVDHLDGDSYNNAASNLRWATIQDNRGRSRNGSSHVGEKGKEAIHSYYLSHREELGEYHHGYYRKNKERLKAYYKAYWARLFSNGREVVKFSTLYHWVRTGRATYDGWRQVH